MDVMTQYPQHPATWESYQQAQAEYNNGFDLAELMRHQMEINGSAEHRKREQEVPQIMADDQQQYFAAAYGWPYGQQQPMNMGGGSPQQAVSPALSNSSSQGASPNSPHPGMLSMPINPYANYGQPGYVSPMHSLPGTPLPANNMLGEGSPQNQYANMGMQMMNGNASHLSRTVYVGNLPADAAVDELLSLVRFGPIENVKILPEKSCAFISFLEPTIASAFHSDVIMRKTQLHGQELRVGWGKPSPVHPNIMMGVQQQGACRNVFVGGLHESTTEQDLRDDLSRFGPIDQVKIVRDKNIGFIHFLSIATAMKVVCTLPDEPEWADKRVNYGKDRCAYVPKNQHQQQQHNLQAAAMAASYTGNLGMLSASMNPMGGFVSAQPGMENSNVLMQAGNRTIYLGNLHPDTTIEEICNCIRGGVLQQIRYIAERHICFVTFVDPNAALAFISSAMSQGLTIHSRRLKIGYGKHSGPAPAGIALCVQAGGSRNVYIGGIDDLETFTADKLRADFGQYGDIELVNILKDKNCGFVNFVDIANAIKAIEGMKHNAEYSTFKIAYGKDRCGNAPRPFPTRKWSNRSGSGDGAVSGEGASLEQAANGVVSADPSSPLPLEQ